MEHQSWHDPGDDDLVVDGIDIGVLAVPLLLSMLVILVIGVGVVMVWL